MGNSYDNKKSVSYTMPSDACLSGSLSCEGGLSGILSEKIGLTGKLTNPGQDVYTGEYVVTPKAFEAQILKTENKVLKDDITVKEVPYFETSNVSGTTVYIAKELEIYGD